MRRIISQQVCRFFPKSKAAASGGDFKHLVCLLEYGGDGHTGNVHNQGSSLEQFKKKHNLTSTDFRHLSDLLGTDYHTLKQLFSGRTEEFNQFMEHKLRPFHTSSRDSIQGKLE
jgi:hypothetical protein